jgi:hypothetical protein
MRAFAAHPVILVLLLAVPAVWALGWFFLDIVPVLVSEPGLLRIELTDANETIGLAIAFTVFNTLRVLFYIPQFLKLIRQQNNLESHSLFMWFSWISANVTTSIYFVQLAGWDQKAIINISNTFMCLLGFSIILYKRKKYQDIRESGFAELMGENQRLRDELDRLRNGDR